MNSFAELYVHNYALLYVWGLTNTHTLPRVLDLVPCSDACCLDAMEED